MKEIQILSKGEVFTAFVDDEDYPVVSRHKWNVLFVSSNKRPYAFTRLYNENKKNGKTFLMHHLILGSSSQVDHKNHNSLDNQKENLRLATYQENGANRKKSDKVGGKPCSSKYKGVTKLGKKWRAVIGFNRKVIQLGSHETEESAALAYNNKAQELYGEFACLNPLPEFNQVV